jgi:hypothetical protein
MRSPLAILASFTLVSAAAAQQPVQPSHTQPGTAADATEPAPPERVAPPAGERPITFSLSARTRLGFSSEFDDEEGELAVSRVGGELGVGIPAGDRGQLQLSLDYEYSNYDFSDTTFIAGSDSPFRDIHRTFFSARYSRQASRQLAWFVGATAGVAFEEGASIGDSWEYGAFGGVKYYLSEKLAIGLGVGFVTQLEDDPLIFPAPVFEWNFAEDWSLSAGGRPGLTLAYDYSDELSFSLSAFYESRDFRLDEDGPVPDGVGRERQVPITLGVQFRPAPAFEIALAAGVNLARTIEIEDEDGDEVADVDADPSPFLGFQFTYRF